MEQHLESTVNTVPASAPKSSEVEEMNAPAPQDETSESHLNRASQNAVTSHQLPIPPASEPMQYRAIGLIHGTYVPSEEQFTRGTLMTNDEENIDAVLLGRVMSLVKKHVDLTTPHLWVVYPRTRPNDEHLHAQIVGIWEPERLHRDADDDADDDSSANLDDITADGDSQTSETTGDSADVVAAVAAEQGAENQLAADQTEAEADPSDSSNPVAPVPDAASDSSEVEQSQDLDPSASATELEGAIASPEEPTLPDSDTPDEAVASAVNEAGTDAADSMAPGDTDPAASETGATAAAEDSTDADTAPQLMKPLRPKFSPDEVVKATPAAEASAHTDAHQPMSSSAPSTTVPTGSAVLAAEPILDDGYFSIRGEVLQFSPEDEQITIRIRQASRKGGNSDKANGSKEKEFKLQLKGRLEGRTVGYFWDLQVQRDGNNLVVTDSTMIGVVPPRKNKRKKVGPPSRGGRSGVKRRYDSGRNEGRSRMGDRPAPAGPARRSTSTKPVLKKNNTSAGRTTSADE